MIKKTSKEFFSNVFYLVRHGKCVHNLGIEKKHVFAGSSADNKLSQEGQEDTRELTQYFNKNKQIDIIVSGSCTELTKYR